MTDNREPPYASAVMLATMRGLVASKRLQLIMGGPTMTSKITVMHETSPGTFKLATFEGEFTRFEMAEGTLIVEWRTSQAQHHAAFPPGRWLSASREVPYTKAESIVGAGSV